MSPPKKDTSVFSFGEDTRFLAAVVCVMAAQLAAGCAASVSSAQHGNPQPTQLSIMTDSIPSAKVQTAYSATVTATGGAAPYTWSLASGSLPAGLNLSSSSGQIAGTPSQAEYSSFTVQVTDSSSPVQTAKAQLSIMVAAATTSVQIVSSSVPSGQLGEAYSTTLTATGGTPPYSWSVSSGALAAGLTLSLTGTISGTPTASGSFSFIAKVTDSTTPTSQTATASLALTIASATYAAVLNWTPSTSPDVNGYNVYRSAVSSSGYVKINSSPLGPSTYTDSTVVSGQTYYYVTTSVDTSGIESSYSDQVQAVIP
jgi:putative Ig domain-containing protein